MTADPALLLLLCLLGTIWASFAGFLASRYPPRRSELMGRSRCDGCGRTLDAVSLIPVLGWLIRRGRCPDCGHSVSPAYPLAELAGALIPLIAILLGSGAIGWPYLMVLGWLLLALSLIDLTHYLLPDWGTLGLILAGLAVAAADPQAVGPGAAAAGAILGYGSLALIGWGYQRLRGRMGLGLGDAKLLAAAGTWLGPWSLPVLVLIASLAGLAAVLILALAGRRVDATTPLAFGPFLSLGFFACALNPGLLVPA